MKQDILRALLALLILSSLIGCGLRARAPAEGGTNAGADGSAYDTNVAPSGAFMTSSYPLSGAL